MLGPGVAGEMSGQTPGVRENDPPKPGELTQTPWEIEGPYYRLGTPHRSNLLEPGVKHGTFDFVIAQFTEEENVTPESLTARA